MEEASYSHAVHPLSSTRYCRRNSYRPQCLAGVVHLSLGKKKLKGRRACKINRISRNSEGPCTVTQNKSSITTNTEYATSPIWKWLRPPPLHPPHKFGGIGESRKTRFGGIGGTLHPTRGSRAKPDQTNQLTQRTHTLSRVISSKRGTLKTFFLTPRQGRIPL